MTREQKMELFKSTSSKVPNKFKDMAIFLTDVCCLNLDDTPIVGEDRNKIIYTICHELSIGSRMTKNKYLLIGGISGITISVGVVATYTLAKKLKESK